MFKAMLKILMACVALVLLMGLAAYFSTSVQRFVALKVLHRLDSQSELGFIKIRWNSVQLQGLKLAQKSMSLNLDNLDVKARFLSFISGTCMEVDACDVSGLKVTVAAAPTTFMTAPGTPPNTSCKVSSGEKSTAEKKPETHEPHEKTHEPIDLLPKAIILKSLKLHGDIYLPEERHVVVDINASNIAPGAQGSLQCTASSTLKAVPEGHFNADFDVLQSGTGEMRQLSLAGKIDSFVDTHMPDLGARFESLGLNAMVDFEVEPTKLTLKTLDSNITDATKLALFSCKLLQSMNIPLSGTIDHATTLNGNLLEIKAEPMPLELLKPLLGKQVLAGQFGGCAMRLAASKGDFSLDVTQPITLTGLGWGPDGTVVIQGLGANFDFDLNYTAPTSEDAQIDFSRGRGKLVLQSMRLGLTHSNGLDWVQLGSVRPINIPLSGDWADILADDGDLFSVGVKSFDLSLFAGILPKDLALSGKMQSSTVLVRAQKGTAMVSASPNFSLQGLSYTQASDAMLQNLDVSFVPTISAQPGKTLEVTLANLALGTTGVQPSWATGSLKAQGDLCEKPRTLHAQLVLTADLAQALTQPVLKPYNHLKSGRADVDAQGSFSQCKGEGDFKFTLKGSNIQSLGNSASPASFDFEGEGQWSQEGGLKADVPLQVQGAKGTSDLQAKVQQTKESGWVVTIDSKTIYMDDVLAVADGFQAPKEKVNPSVPPTSNAVASTSTTPTPAVSTAVATHTTKPAGPLWGATKADVTLQMDKVIQNNYALLENCQGHFFMNPTQMNLDKLDGVFAGAPLQCQGVLAYNEATPQSAYDLKAQLAVTGFDVARFLKSTGLSEQSPVVGLFDFSGNLSGQGPEMMPLLEQAQGDMSLTSNKGTFYLLAAGGKTAQAGAAVVGIAGVVNSVTGNKVGQIDTLSRVTQLLQKIDYTELRLAAKRGSDLNIILNPFLVQGTELRLFGTGSVTYQDNVAIANQPLLVTASLDAKGTPAKTLSDINLLSTQQDTEGYYVGPKFKITGTPANPNFSELHKVLEKAAMGVATSGGGNNQGVTTPATQAVQGAVKSLKGILGV